MAVRVISISEAGRSFQAPAITLGNTIVVGGTGFPRIARINDEPFNETRITADPQQLISQIVDSGLPADVFTFAQKIHEREPRHPYHFEWDNVAAADTRSFQDWWGSLPQSTRKNCRRAERSGIVVSTSKLDDRLAEGIKRIYDESPYRQGRRFWHYGKPVDVVKTINSSYLNRSEFIVAHLNEELVGFLKFVYVGQIAPIMQILASQSHSDKRPMNALIAKAVEVCSANGVSELVYSKFHYGNKTQSPLSEFKSRNGFRPLEFPRYYIPLNLRGRIAVALRLHRGLMEILPSKVINSALHIREKLTADSGRSTSKDQSGGMRD